MTFGSAAPLSLGVEEELLLVDAETLDLAPVFQEVVPDPEPQIKPELFACLLEVATTPCADAQEALEQLQGLRSDVRARAASRGATAIATGTHPTASTAGQMILPLERYQRIRKQLGTKLTTQVVCGLHVHVAMPDAQTALRAFEGVVPWLPTLLALSANSPYVGGAATGLRSTRARRLLLLPTGGTPPLLPDWSAWEEVTAGDDTRRHWDAWPRPEHGTLEVRILDQQTDVRRSAGFAAIVQSLVAAVLDDEIQPYDRALYTRRRAEAARSAPDSSEVAALAALLEPSELALHVLTGRPEAERQLELGPEQALRDLAVASIP